MLATDTNDEYAFPNIDFGFGSVRIALLDEIFEDFPFSLHIFTQDNRIVTLELAECRRPILPFIFTMAPKIRSQNKVSSR